MYYQTIYTRGAKGHMHITPDGSRLACYQKHSKKSSLFNLTLVLLLVEIVIGYLLLLRAI